MLIKPEHLLYRFTYGFAIGDALGVPYEGSSPSDIPEKLDMIGMRVHQQEAGTWSDDTSLHLATCKAILNDAFWVNRIAQALVTWVNTNYPTVDGEIFDAGATTRRSIKSIYDDPTSLVNGTGINDNGNGSLMRIAPLAFIACTDEDVRAVSALTHGHHISCNTCVIYVNALRAAMTATLDGYALFNLNTDSIFKQLRLNKQECYADIANYARNNGYVVNALICALWAYDTGTSYEDVVTRAVKLGNDTDTVAAIAGGLASLKYPIKQAWLDKLRGKAIIDEIFN
jgi:ADP-ribosylglycohydrolase